MNQETNREMNRREVLIATGGAVLASTVGTAFAAEHNHHYKVGKNLNVDLVATASHCVTAGEQCVKICFDLLAQKDTAMAECGRSVGELISECTSLIRLAAYGSPYLKEAAKLTMLICDRCEKECLKHKGHQQCLDCANACKECSKACKKYAV